MKKIIVSLLAVIILFAGGCTGPTAGVAVVQRPEQNATGHETGSGGTGGQLTVLYIPLDNRPINYDNVLSLARIAGVELLTPPTGILGSEGPTGGQDGPGNPTAVRRWLEQNAGRADAWIVSLDMLLYGGLAPSRSHDRDRQKVLADMYYLRELLVEKQQKDTPVYLFGTIMRSAASSASPKQPGYFKDYGDKILSLSKLWDLADRGEATPEQLTRLERVKKEIPPEVLDDYLQRRETNLAALRQATNFVAGGLVDYLVLGRDDCTPHGFTRVDLRVLERDIRQRGLADRVDSYPGADELGAVLLARAVNNALGQQPEVYVDWATPRGPEITALYEDVTLEENVRLHIKSAGARMVDNPEEADLVLAVNSPVDKVMEASMQPSEAVPDEHHIAQVKRINKWLEQGNLVAVADVAYANGADRAFMEALAAAPNSLPRLSGYAGCNTAGNSIGMALAHGLIYETALNCTNSSSANATMETAHREYLLTRIMEDWGFQAVVRPAIIKTGHYGAISAGSALDNAATRSLEKEITYRLNYFLANNLASTFGDGTGVDNVILPWNRLFDISFTLEHIQQ